MESCLYEGTVRHRRFAPVERAFTYRLFMTYLDLAELPEVFDASRLWSARGWAPARFLRSGHLGNAAVPLDEAVRSHAESQTGFRPKGPVRLLTHLRYFGYCFNPVSFYYCFEPAGDSIDTIVAEVNNTPWREQHAYVLREPESVTHNGARRYRFGKRLHVSPFMGMDMEYRCVLGKPGKTLVVHFENWQRDACVFDATMTLRRKEITPRAPFFQLVRFPFMTQKVVLAIYWQALLLWLKRFPVYPHPGAETEKEAAK